MSRRTVLKVTCTHCGRELKCLSGHKAILLKCPHCKQLIPAPLTPSSSPAAAKRRRARRRDLICLVAGALLLLAAFAFWSLFLHPVRMVWPDRRPIGTLFLADNAGVSKTNPRGWFNDPSLDFTGTNGVERFRTALLQFADQSITNLLRVGAQGVIVWDLEGEQFPHKTSFIGDPRQLDRLAPEMAAAADEFFARFRHAGLRVGLTIRPQQLKFDGNLPRQTPVLNLKRCLQAKMDYARARWGATIFYVDSNAGLLRPDELWQLRRLVRARPDLLLIPEHTFLPYFAFSAPYSALQKGGPALTPRRARSWFPESFLALDIGDATENEMNRVADARLNGEILLFHAWYWGDESKLLNRLEHGQKTNSPAASGK